MKNFENNKKVLSHSPNYYKIINEEYDEDDIVASRLIQIFVKFTFSVNPEDKKMVKTLEKIDLVMSKYFSNDDFRTELVKTLTEIKIKKNIENVILYVVECLNNAYDKFLESYTRNLYIPKWI